MQKTSCVCSLPGLLVPPTVTFESIQTWGLETEKNKNRKETTTKTLRNQKRKTTSQQSKRRKKEDKTKTRGDAQKMATNEKRMTHEKKEGKNMRVKAEKRPSGWRRSTPRQAEAIGVSKGTLDHSKNCHPHTKTHGTAGRATTEGPKRYPKPRSTPETARRRPKLKNVVSPKISKAPDRSGKRNCRHPFKPQRKLPSPPENTRRRGDSHRRRPETFSKTPKYTKTTRHGA